MMSMWITKAGRRRIGILLAVALLASGSQARDRGQYASTNPELKAWFDKLESKKGPCCSDADGTALSDVDWEAPGQGENKSSHYRVRIENLWWDVPPEAVITEPNRVGRTMVWPMYRRWPDRLTIDIRCFMPGSMT